MAQVSLGLLYVPFTMQRQLISHNSLHNTLVAYVLDVIKPIKMYNVTIKILILKYQNCDYMFRPYKAIIRYHNVAWRLKLVV
jgi:hypothetical protein